MTRILLLATLLLALGACAPAAMELDPSLHESAPAMAVRGRQGWQLGRTLRFGGYRAGEVRRGWTVGYDVPFVVRFQGARERIGFRQLGPAGNAADVRLVHRFRSVELPLAGEHFALSVVDGTALAGSVAGASRTWELLVHLPEGAVSGRPREGFLRSDGAAFDIREVRRYAGSPLPAGEPAGFEFLSRGRVVGAVEVLGDGRVWLSSELGAEERLALAATASALLLRHDLQAGPLASGR